MEQYIEDAYFTALVQEGLDPSVLGFIQAMADVNHRTTTYFIMAALEGFKEHFDQEEPNDETKH